jgi:hypothetical protein
MVFNCKAIPKNPIGRPLRSLCSGCPREVGPKGGKPAALLLRAEQLQALLRLGHIRPFAGCSPSAEQQNRRLWLFIQDLRRIMAQNANMCVATTFSAPNSLTDRGQHEPNTKRNHHVRSAQWSW